MTIICWKCGNEATYYPPDEKEVPFFENGHYECNNHECCNDGWITDGSHEGNKQNGFVEI